MAPSDRMIPTTEVAVDRTTIWPLDSWRPPDGECRVIATLKTPDVRARTLT